MKKIKISILTVMLCLNYIIRCNRSDSFEQGDYSSLKKYMTRFINEKMKKNQIIGLSLALVDDQKIVWTEGFGFADKENKIQATDKTVYKTGSISKLFTAVAALKLASQNMIDLNKPIKTYIPNFHIKSRFKNSDPITIHHLMTHHSGIPLVQYSSLQESNQKKLSDIIEELNSIYSVFPPNYKYLYSNLGVDLLGLVVEKVSGMNFNEFMKQHVFQDLDMNYSSFEEIKENHKLLSKEYQQGKPVPPFHWPRVWPSGSLYSSAEDIANFIKMILAHGRIKEHQFLEAILVDSMLSPQNKEIPLDFNFEIGLNWFINHTQHSSLHYSGKVCSHEGGAGATTSSIVILPDHQLGVIVLNNSNESTKLTTEIADEILIVALEIKKGLRPIKLKQMSKPIFQSPGKKTEQIVGLYSHGIIGYVEIEKNHFNLLFKGQGRTFKMLPNADGFYSIENKKMGIMKDFGISVKNINNEMIFIEKRNNSIAALGKMVAKRPIREIWKKRSGKYVNTKKSNSPQIQITMKDDLLFFNEYILLPLNDSLAVVQGFNRVICGETIVFKKMNGQDVLIHNGKVLKKWNLLNNVLELNN